MVRVGIFGASGYTGYELIKLLANHPQATTVFATSRTYAGQRIGDLYPLPPVLGGGVMPHDLTLTDPDEVWSADPPLAERIDVAFFCLPHGQSIDAVRRACEAGVRVVDLSADYRLSDPAAYQRWYKVAHGAPRLLAKAVYGLTEVYRDRIARADLVGNPGCYPTGALLGLYPLVAGGHLASERVSHFVEVNENFRPYSIGRAHRHLSELEQELAAWGLVDARVTFSPHLLPVDRGILSTIYVSLEPGWSVGKLVELYAAAYAGESFVHVLPEGRLSSLADVVHTNRCAISFAAAGGDDFIVVTAIDNLVKGASGQAVQNMNVMFGLEETQGLVG